MKILFIHQNFPGQFKHLAPALAARGDEVRALYIDGQGLKAIQGCKYSLKRGNARDVHPWARDFESKMLRAEACAEAMSQWRDQGFEPDLVIAHPGWGEGLAVRDVFPRARQLHFVEWYYHYEGGDVGFDPEFGAGDVPAPRVRAKNAVNLLSLAQMDAGYSPTEWQRSRVIEPYRSRIEVIHDGVDTGLLQPAPERTVHFNREGVTVGRNDELVTFINRNLEPMRGWHIFARSLPRLMRERPHAHVAIVGDKQLSYGQAAPHGKSWRETIWAEVGDKVDMARVHFLGRVPYATFIQLMQASSCHVYLTMPFVLSWSMLEAMAVEALVVASDTPPVREVIEDGENGLLTPFLEPDALADKVAAVLAEPERYAAIRAAARATIVERYDLKSICLPAQLDLVDRVAGGVARPVETRHAIGSAGR